METEVVKPKNRIHPHKFTLWVAIGSIIMMFAGLTSAYIVKRNQAGWVSFDIPASFWYSTVVILFSSLTIHKAGLDFRERRMARYRLLMGATLLLGLLFVGLQSAGFRQLWDSGKTLQSNVAYSFLYVIVGLHALHVLGGIVGLAVMSARSFSTRVRIYSRVPVDLICTYWHFVDILWIYLLIFLLMIR